MSTDTELYAEIKELRQQRDKLHAANNRLLEERRAAEIVSFLIGKAQWSLATFGPGPRTKGVCAHIRKELAEIESDPLDLEEWVDVFMLATDGYWRAWVEKHRQAWEWKEGDTAPSMQDMALDFIRDIRAKHAKNEARTWPEPLSEDLPVEHDRSGE